MDAAVISTELQRYNTTDAEIAKRRKYLDYTIKDLSDTDGYSLVHKARMEIKSMRIAVTKRGKELREDAIKFQKAVISEEQRIIGQLSPIEDHLADEEARIDEENARLKREAEEREAARVKARADKLYSLNCRFDGHTWTYDGATVTHEEVIKCTDDQFKAFCNNIEAKQKEEREAKADEERKQQAEIGRLKQIAAEQAERERLIEAREKAVKDAQEKLEREKRAEEAAKLKAEQDRIRAEELEKAKKEAAERAVLAEKMRLEQEVAAKAAKEEKARLAAERKAARAPDKVKLQNLLAVLANMQYPELKSEEAQEILEDLANHINMALEAAVKRLEAL
jgi:hypothetical protein